MVLAIVATLLHFFSAMAQPENKTKMAAAQSGTGERMSDADIRKRLTEEQYQVTMECDTEPPFKNAYWDNHKPGIYVDIVSGEPLFTSLDKFNSGTGWPSFTQPITKEKLEEKPDLSGGRERTEVRTRKATRILDMSSPMDPGTKAGCVTASTPRRCALFQSRS